MEKNGKMLPKHRCYGAGSINLSFMATDNFGNNGLDRVTDLLLGITAVQFQRLDSFLIWQFPVNEADSSKDSCF